MILDAAETVLGTFGFDRTVYGDSKKRRGKWWQELIHERRKDIQTEMVDLSLQLQYHVEVVNAAYVAQSMSSINFAIPPILGVFKIAFAAASG